VLFQPHRYTRTHDLMQEFARSFNNADVLFITGYLTRRARSD
jgi:UDP-N-acetylmuramate--alanine ligase